MKKSPHKKFLTILNSVVFIISLFFPAIGAANVTSMYLDPSSKTVNAGDTFSLDLALNNSDSTEFNTILAWLTYDSNVLEVQDSDLLHSGVQILSDPLGLYIFDYHMANGVSGGNIDFEEGYNPASSVQTGVFARIVFKALAPAVTSPINFNFNGTWGVTPTTAVLYGDDVLGSASNHTDGAIGSYVSVNAVPEPSCMFLFLGGLGWLPFFTILCRRR